MEVEITVEPSDPGIEYSGDWSSTGGSCTNGTRTTLQVEAKFTYKFRGIELTVSFVAKDAATVVSVELNGIQIDEFTIPAESSPQCQLKDSWNRNFTSPSDQQEISFTFKGSLPSAAHKRAPAALELGQIRYIPPPQSNPGTQKNSAVRETAGSAVGMLASAMTVLLLGFA